MSKPAWGQQTNEAPQEFAQVTTLGHFKRAFGKRDGVQSAKTVMITGLAIGVVGLLIAVATQQIFSALPFAPFALVFFVVGAFQMRGSARLVATYHDGLAALVGSKVLVFPWNDITTIFCKDRYVSGKRSSFNSHHCQLSKANGESVTLLSIELEDAPQLITEIKKHVATNVLPALQKSYNAGEPLTFGPLTVSKKIIEHKGQRLEWSAIHNVVMKNGRLIVTPKGGKAFSVRVSKIPNVDLVCELIGVTFQPLDLSYIF
jgi:hypothetical protein